MFQDEVSKKKKNISKYRVPIEIDIVVITIRPDFKTLFD